MSYIKNIMENYGVLLKHSLFFLFALLFMYSRHRYGVVLEDLEDPTFILFVLIFIVFSFWGLYHKDPRIRESTQRSITAFLIAYMAHADLVFIVPIIVYIFTYHTGIHSGWI